MKIKMLMPVMAFVGMLCVGCGSDENEKEKNSHSGVLKDGNLLNMQ